VTNKEGIKMINTVKPPKAPSNAPSFIVRGYTVPGADGVPVRIRHIIGIGGDKKFRV
jgi:hypothetical protein